MKENKNNLPTCVGIIMDGNRRWAKERGLPTALGHRAGYKKLKEVVLWAKEAGVSNVVVYAFSTENWGRSEKEIDTLMKLFGDVLKQQDFFKKEKIKVRFIGQTEKFSDNLKKGIKEMEKSTKKYDGLRLSIALSYGGRAEIVSAVNTLLQRGTKKVSEKEFSSHLWTAGIPDPEIIIRTGGERRLSNFLSWQSVYSELFFTDTYWPAFTKREFKSILAEYAKREKRKGK
jgi:undecaprenyl diphosphate synthase